MGGFPGHFKHDLIGTIGIPFPSKIHYKVSRKTSFAIFSILIIMVKVLNLNLKSGFPSKIFKKVQIPSKKSAFCTKKVHFSIY